MVTFDQLVARVQDDLDRTDPDALYTVERVVRSTLHSIGFCVADTGEVVDPAPKPVITFPSYRSDRRRR